MATLIAPYSAVLIGADHSDDLLRKTLFRMRPWWRVSSPAPDTMHLDCSLALQPPSLTTQAGTREDATDDDALDLIKKERFNLLWSDSLFVGRSPLFGWVKLYSASINFRTP